MRPKNFPGRKQSRRKVAYEALETRWKGHAENEIPFSAKKEMSSLKDLLSKGSMIGIRSKKPK